MRIVGNQREGRRRRGWRPVEAAPARTDFLPTSANRLGCNRFCCRREQRKFALVTDDFTTENGMLTPTLKIKRAEVMAVHGDALAALYD